MNINERLNEFIKYRGLDVRNFEKCCGLSNGSVSKIGAGIRKSTIDRISNSFPELNIKWLLNGEGKMINQSITPLPAIPKNDTPTPISPPAIEVALKEIAAQRKLTERALEQIERQQEHIGRLITIIEKK